MSVGRFQQMDVYVAALDYVGQTRALVLRLRRNDAMLADQLHRSVISVPLNIAEGAGEFSRPTRRASIDMHFGHVPRASRSSTCAPGSV